MNVNVVAYPGGWGGTGGAPVRPHCHEHKNKTWTRWHTDGTAIPWSGFEVRRDSQSRGARGSLNNYTLVYLHHPVGGCMQQKKKGAIMQVPNIPKQMFQLDWGRIKTYDENNALCVNKGFFLLRMVVRAFLKQAPPSSCNASNFSMNHQNKLKFKSMWFFFLHYSNLRHLQQLCFLLLYTRLITIYINPCCLEQHNHNLKHLTAFCFYLFFFSVPKERGSGTLETLQEMYGIKREGG